MTGGGETGGGRAGTPRGELAKIHAGRRQAEADTRARIMRAALATCGERGYRRASVQDVIDRYGGNRVEFYRHFGSKAECFAAAHEVGIGSLCRRLLRAGAGEEDWRRGVRAALAELAAFVGEDPAAARGLLVEVHVAGGVCVESREEAYGQLARALDRGRSETEGPGPPAVTARVMIGAVEFAVAGALAPDREEVVLPVCELEQLIVLSYLGAEAAEWDGPSQAALP